VPLKEEDIVVSIVKIDLTRGRNNPLQRYLRKTQTMIIMKAMFIFCILFDEFANSDLI
jgi:hypothetical protein